MNDDYETEFDYDGHDFYGNDYDEEDRTMFADPGGNSCLRAATPTNPRNLPCPRCKDENVLTPADRQLGYICDRCADAAERGYDY